MTKSLRLVGFLAGAFLALAGSAQAAAIDFTQHSWGSIEGLESYTAAPDVNGVRWTLDANPLDANFYHTTGWGLGIQGVPGGIDKHEAEYPEFFTLTFSRAVSNLFIGLTRLNRIRETGFIPYFEGGYYKINGGPRVEFYQSVLGRRGEFLLNLGSNITSIEFSGLGLVSPGRFNREERNGFKLASLDYTSDRINVPEPASLTLLGFGFAAAGVVLRRRRKSA